LSNGFAQNKDLIIPGPNNVLSNGVIDGIVVKEDLPVRPRVEYEFVRESDLVWSKRLFSRIDKRERVNHPLFYPNEE
jgi:phosphoribosylamine-glycine ligase